MKVLKNNLSEVIKLYLEDTESYGEASDLILAESVLDPLKNLILESNMSVKDILNEAYKKASLPQKSIIKDFTIYLNNI
jgi:hypothetical protein